MELFRICTGRWELERTSGIGLINKVFKLQEAEKRETCQCPWTARKLHHLLGNDGSGGICSFICCLEANLFAFLSSASLALFSCSACIVAVMWSCCAMNSCVLGLILNIRMMVSSEVDLVSVSCRFSFLRSLIVPRLRCV